jgi:hypothetical protein
LSRKSKNLLISSKVELSYERLRKPENLPTKKVVLRKSRFLELKDMTQTKETFYGTVANDWNFIPANVYCEKVTDGTHDSPKAQTSGKHLITSKHIKGREIDFDNAYLIDESEFNKINLRSKVDQWDVIISMIGEYCGFSYVERNELID